jgi:hypothetical protein
LRSFRRTQKLLAWDPKTGPLSRDPSFLFGSDWITATFGKIGRYSIVRRLRHGLSRRVDCRSAGVSGAIYVSEVAVPAEKSLIKPYKFISRFRPWSRLFGIAVVRQPVRALSQASFMKWVPFSNWRR